MPIQIKAPDGSIAQFPDGMADADIEKVMAQQYPQPSMLDRAIASPVGRFAHDAVLSIPMGLGALLSKIDPTAPDQATVDQMYEAPYQRALSRNRNTPGYAKARTEADSVQAVAPSGLGDQITAPFNSTMAGILGAPGGFDAMNANADAQTAAQEGYASRHPVLSFGAGLLGGVASGSPGAPAALPAPAINAITRTPEAAAATYVRRLMDSSQTAPNTAALRAVQIGGKPITSAETIGRPAEVALGALARREGTTADALSGQMAARGASAPARILDDYATAAGIHPSAAQGNIDAFIEANKKRASPLYDEAYAANQNIASPVLDRILETPAGKRALASARENMQNDMSLLGTPDAELMDQAREGGTVIPSRGVASGMKLRVYDYVKRSLGDEIDAATRAGKTHEADILTGLKNRMVKALDDADVTGKAGPNSVKPEGGAYARARASAGEYLGAKEQFENGQAFILDQKITPKQMADHLAGLGQSEAEAFKGGVANRLFNAAQNGKLDPKIFNAPAVQQKLATILGPQRASQFISQIRQEARMAGFARTRVPGAGSPTAEYQAAMADQDGAATMAMDALNLGHDTVRQGFVPAIANMAVNKAKNAAAAYVTRGMSIPVRDAAGEMLMLPPADLATRLDGIPVVPPRAPLQLPRLPQNGALPYGLLLQAPQLMAPAKR